MIQKSKSNYRVKFILAFLLMGYCFHANAQNTYPKTVSKNNIKISWHFEKDRIYFEMSAPTDGWVTIGFNTTAGTKGAYLLMGNIVDSKASVVEHYTLSPGNYKTIESLGEVPQVSDVSGSEISSYTRLKFSLPLKSTSDYQKDLMVGTEYTMIIAYSREDDFQHHSTMRTAIDISL